MVRKMSLILLMLVLALFVVRIPTYTIPQVYAASCRTEKDLGKTDCKDDNYLYVCKCTSSCGSSIYAKYGWAKTNETCGITPTNTLIPTATQAPAATATQAPAATATLAPTITIAPTITQAPNCSLKGLGDANCDNMISDADYVRWSCELLGNGSCAGVTNQRTADFDLVNGVNINDFEIWRRNFQEVLLTPTLTPTPTIEPMSMENITDPAQYIGQTVQQICQTKGTNWNCIASCNTYPGTPYNSAFLRMTQGVGANTISSDDCYFSIPDNISSLSICCIDLPIVPEQIIR